MPSPIAPSPNSIRRDPALDGLRGLAVLLVYLFHYGGGLSSPHAALKVFGYATQASWVGVELFFVLSGFLITGLCWECRNQPGAFSAFLARRAWRIVPLYLLALLAAFLVSVPGGRDNAATLPALLVYLTFLQNVPTLVSTALQFPSSLPLYHLWTVAVEVQFYLVWPLLLRTARTRRTALWICAGTFACSCLFRAVAFPAHAFTSTRSPTVDWSPFLLTRAGALALGGGLALLQPQELATAVRRYAVPLLTSSVLVFGVTGWAQGGLLLSHPAQFTFALPASEVACAALLGLALQPGFWRTVLSHASLRWLGRISYGFYVFHILLEPLFDQIGASVAHASAGSVYIAVRFLAAFPISAAAAWLSFRCLEQPLLSRCAGPGALPVRSCIQGA